MDTYNVHAPDVVATNIIRDITNVRRMTLAAAARFVGKTPQNFHNMLKGKSRFSMKTALLLNEKFKYSIPYLTQGVGQLYESEEDKPRSEMPFRPDDVEDVDAFGAYYYDSSSLTEREKLLNEYAKKYSHLYEDVDLSVTGRCLDLASIFEEADEMGKMAGIQPQSVKEYSILKNIVVKYVLIKRLLDPKEIAKELESL